MPFLLGCFPLFGKKQADTKSQGTNTTEANNLHQASRANGFTESVRSSNAQTVQAVQTDIARECTQPGSVAVRSTLHESLASQTPAPSAYAASQTLAVLRQLSYFTQNLSWDVRELAAKRRAENRTPTCCPPLPPSPPQNNESNLVILKALGELNGCTQALVMEVSATTARLFEESAYCKCCPLAPPPPPPPPPPPKVDLIILQNLLDIRYGIEVIQQEMREEACRARPATARAQASRPVIQETLDVIKDIIRTLNTPPPGQMQAIAAAQMAAIAAAQEAQEEEAEAADEVEHMMREIRDSIYSLEDRESRPTVYTELGPEPVSIFNGQGLVGNGSLMGRRSLAYSRANSMTSNPRGTLPSVLALEAGAMNSFNLVSPGLQHTASMVAPKKASMASALPALSIVAPHSASMASANPALSIVVPHSASMALANPTLSIVAPHPASMASTNPALSIVAPHSASMASVPGGSAETSALQRASGSLNSVNLGSQDLQPVPSIVAPRLVSMASVPRESAEMSALLQQSSASLGYLYSVNLGSQDPQPAQSIVTPNSVSMASALEESSERSALVQQSSAVSGYLNSIHSGSQDPQPVRSLVTPPSVSMTSASGGSSEMSALLQRSSASPQYLSSFNIGSQSMNAKPSIVIPHSASMASVPGSAGTPPPQPSL